MIDKSKEWLPIKGYEKLYMVSSCGLVYSNKRNRLLKHGTYQNGYLYYELWKDNKRKLFRVHRLVAMHFIPNPENKPMVCHKDDNRKNNHVDNLWWGTSKENLQDMATKDRRKKRILNVETGEVFIGIQATAINLGINMSSLSMVLNGKRKQVGGMMFKYLEGEL